MFFLGFWKAFGFHFGVIFTLIFNRFIAPVFEYILGAFWAHFGLILS